ncbi:MAG TPA: glycosyltransferase, partial [Gemmatimonadaceae bacterium]|nr:glycosyltransferase [Gemmatimonadaceae bacterium]
RGAGIKVKVLESMLAGLPVVGSVVAAEGIAAGPAEGLFRADDPEEAAGHVAALVGDPGRARAAGEAARAFAITHFDWSRACGALTEAFDA